MAQTKTEYRKCKPDGAHKSWRFQEKPVGQKWRTIYRPEYEVLNKLLKQGVLSPHDAEARAEEYLKTLYKERDASDPIHLCLPGNLKIFNEWYAKTFTPRRLKQLATGYPPSEKAGVLKALKVLVNQPVDGDVEALQAWVDEHLEDDPNRHHRTVGKLNRLRKYLKLPLLIPDRKDRKDVAYLTKPEVDKLIAAMPEPYKALVAVAFYTGLRRGEIFALGDNPVHGDVIDVRWQWHLHDRALRLPKNRKTRTAYIIPGGEVWVEKWLKMKDQVNPTLDFSKMVRTRTGGKRFHDLRHSYAVYLISQGLSLDWVAQSLGNSRDVCERHYASHILQTDSIELMRTMMKKLQKKTKAKSAKKDKPSEAAEKKSKSTKKKPSVA